MRAYATNSVGTAYGSEISFTTLASLTTVEIMVRDGNSWSSSDTSLSVSTGATINLYATEDDVINNNPAYTKTTDETGIVKIPINFLSQYFLTVRKGNAGNIINGFLVIGIFQSQDDIARSPTQTPPGAIGEAKFADINNDAIIEQTDKVIADVIVPAENGTITKTVIIYQ